MYNEIDLDRIDLNQGPPQEEPERQYYYMAKCREWARNFERGNGRRPTFFIQTFGCQMNARDSEKIQGIMKTIGYEEGDSAKADFLLYNTCTVRENANLKVYGRLGQLKKQKKENPDMIIALCGCMMQEPDVVEKIKKSYRNVDIIFGTHNIFKLAELLALKLFSGAGSGKMIVDIWEGTDQIVEELPNERKYFFKSGVNIMFGCNNFCSYCIVPYVRGRERSREPEDIIAEIEGMVADGVVEVMLLGQNVNSYGKNLKNPVSFAQLLRQVEQIEGLERIRFMTSHPKDLSDDLIDVMRDSKKICKQMHLPLQSGSSRLLEVMNRHYTKEDYLLLVEKIRRAVPDISLTTDIIVGFPGETEEEFQITKEYLERIHFYEMHIFKYSRREGTKAAAMKNQVPEPEKTRRSAILLDLEKKMSEEFRNAYLGETVTALLEEKMEFEGKTYFTGYTKEYVKVAFEAGSDLTNQFVTGKISEQLTGDIYLMVEF